MFKVIIQCERDKDKTKAMAREVIKLVEASPYDFCRKFYYMPTGFHNYVDFGYQFSKCNVSFPRGFLKAMSDLVN